jgi:hypothetical protein
MFAKSNYIFFHAVYLCKSYFHLFFFCRPADIRRSKLMDKYNELKVTHSWFMWLLIFHTYGHLWPYASVHAVHLQEMESLMLLWRSEGRRMPPKIIATCHTERKGVVYFYHFVAVLMSQKFTSNHEYVGVTHRPKFIAELWLLVGTRYCK